MYQATKYDTYFFAVKHLIYKNKVMNIIALMYKFVNTFAGYVYTYQYYAPVSSSGGLRPWQVAVLVAQDVRIAYMRAQFVRANVDLNIWVQRTSWVKDKF